MSKNNDLTRGGQITFHYWTMLFQILKKTSRLAFVVILFFTSLISYFLLDSKTLLGTWYYWNYKIQGGLFMSDDRIVHTVWNGQTYTNTLGQMINNPVLVDANANFWLNVQIALLISVLVGLAIMMVAIAFFRHQGRKQTDSKLKSGRRIVKAKELESELKKKKRQSTFLCDGRQLFTKDFEVQHMLIAGTTGSGKSVLIRKLLTWIRGRGDKAIVFDKGCTLTGKFYNPETDVLLNPFDERCAYWDVWSDANDETDFENMAAALIPQHGDGDPFWVQSARTIFSAIAHELKDKPDRSTERLLELMLTAKLQELNKFLKDTEAASLTSDKVEKMAISIKSVLAAYVKSLRFLSGLDETDENGKHKRENFSIREWVQDDEKQGFLFLSSGAQQHASLRPLISMWLSIASTALLGLKENPNRRIWVIIDEAPSLHKLPELASTIAEVRKFGGCYLIGIQSYAQLAESYGDKTAKVIYDLLNTRTYFRAPTKSMAQMASDELGQQELKIATENVSYGANSIRDGVSLGEQTITRPAVKPDDIMMMENLQCWLRPIGDLPISRLELKYDKYPDLCSSFIKRGVKVTERMEKISSLLSWVQMGALNVVDPEAKKQLLSVFEGQFDSDEERKIEGQFLSKRLRKVPEGVLDKEQEQKVVAKAKVKKQQEQAEKQAEDERQAQIDAQNAYSERQHRVEEEFSMGDM